MIPLSAKQISMDSPFKAVLDKCSLVGYFRSWSASNFLVFPVFNPSPDGRDMYKTSSTLNRCNLKSPEVTTYWQSLHLSQNVTELLHILYRLSSQKSNFRGFFCHK
jgi:hypothetical protein